MMLARDRQSGEHVTIKRIKLKSSAVEVSLRDHNMVQTNKDVPSYFLHPNITNLKNYFQHDTYMCCVFEYAGKATIQHQISKQSLSFSLTQRYFSQIVQGVAWFHKLGLAHRHLSLDNVLVLENDACKLCDFGLAIVQVFERTDQGDRMKSPEALTKPRYDEMAADIWALGLMLYTMLTRDKLFKRASESDEKFKKFSETGTLESVSKASRPLLELLNGMLKIDPAERWSIEQVLQHPFSKLRRGNSEIKVNASPRTLMRKPGRPGSSLELVEIRGNGRRTSSAQDLSAILPTRVCSTRKKPAARAGSSIELPVEKREETRRISSEDASSPTEPDKALSSRLKFSFSRSFRNSFVLKRSKTKKGDI